VHYTITVRPGATKAQVDGHLSIRLTDNQAGGNVFNATGRAYYNQPIPLWDPITNATTSFTTSFTFAITIDNSSLRSSGIAFSVGAPGNSFGGWLGLFNETTDGNSSNRMVAVDRVRYVPGSVGS
jgi:hypothetical protein